VARAQLLAAGIELVAARSLGDTLGHLRINDLARGAGLTSGAFYHYWSGQDAYRAEVLVALLAGDRSDARADLFSVPGSTVPTDPVACVLDAVGRATGLLADDPGHRLELALWVHDEPRATDELRRRAQRTDAAFAAAIGRLLEAGDRRADPLGGLGPMATIAVALSDGLRTQALIDGAVLAPRPSGPPAALLALLLLVGGTARGTAEVAPGHPAPAAAPPEVPERRRRLVDLGVAAARAQPTGNALDHIRAEDVVARLGLTIGAFYHYWESQDDYRDDLLDALFAADRYVDTATIASRADDVRQAATLDEAVRSATSWYWSVTVGHPENRMLFGLLAVDDPYLAPHLAAEAADLRSAWQTVVEALLDRFGLHLRPPLDPALLVLGVSAVLDGLLVRHGLDARGLGPDNDGWTLWGRATRALVTAATAPAGDDRDLATTAREALGSPS